MMNIKYQHQQIGSKIIQENALYLKKLGYKKIKLGVDQGNAQSLSFWLKKAFYNHISRKLYYDGI